MVLFVYASFVRRLRSTFSQTIFDFIRIRTNLGKIRCWGAGEASPPTGIAELGSEVWRGDLPIEKQGLIMLGSPIGSVEFAAKWCEHTATRQNRILDQLGKIREAQSR